MGEGFRCQQASSADGEQLAGTAPTERDWLLVEYSGAWGAQAVAESRLPDLVRERLAGLGGVRVQLIRRYAGAGGAGIRLFRASLGEDPRVRTLRVGSASDLLDVLVGDVDGAGPIDERGWSDHSDPLLLVCTNGRRDLCCAEFGRPVAAELSRRWPEATWETTHLGGHRFSATMVLLPSGVTLGRLSPQTAPTAVAEVLAGRMPAEVARGRAGLSARAQVAELHLREALALAELESVRILAEDQWSVTCLTPYGERTVHVVAEPGPDRRLSCGGGGPKPTIRFRTTPLPSVM